MDQSMPCINRDETDEFVFDYDKLDNITAARLTKNCIHKIQKLIESGNDPINKKYSIHDETMLHYVARYNWIQMVQYLIENGADVNALDGHIGTPLHDAAGSGNMCVIKYLLDCGANKSHLNRENETAAEVARSRGYCEVAKYIESFELVLTKGVYL